MILGGEIMEKIYTAQQIADYCQVGVETVWRWFREGQMKYYTVGRKKMVTETDLKAFIESGDMSGDNK